MQVSYWPVLGQIQFCSTDICQTIFQIHVLQRDFYCLNFIRQGLIDNKAAIVKPMLTTCRCTYLNQSHQAILDLTSSLLFQFLFQRCLVFRDNCGDQFQTALFIKLLGLVHVKPMHNVFYKSIYEIVYKYYRMYDKLFCVFQLWYSSWA